MVNKQSEREKHTGRHMLVVLWKWKQTWTFDKLFVGISSSQVNLYWESLWCAVVEGDKLRVEWLKFNGTENETGGQTVCIPTEWLLKFESNWKFEGLKGFEVCWFKCYQKDQEGHNDSHEIPISNPPPHISLPIINTDVPNTFAFICDCDKSKHHRSKVK